MKIKFRGWDKIKKIVYSAEELGEDQLTIMPNGRGFANISGIDTKRSQIDDNQKIIPLQYIGLRDKNGVEIYEGDIVAKFDFVDPYYRSVVVRHLGAFGYYNMGDFIAFASNYHFNWVNGKSEQIQIIGNIHENPELIKSSKQEK